MSLNLGGIIYLKAYTYKYLDFPFIFLYSLVFLYKLYTYLEGLSLRSLGSITIIPSLYKR